MLNQSMIPKSGYRFSEKIMLNQSPAGHCERLVAAPMLGYDHSIGSCDGKEHVEDVAMTSMLGKLGCAAAVLVLSATVASAQGVGITPDGQMSFSPFKQQDKRPMTQDEYERQKKLDDAYKAATNKIPVQRSNDPWATVRPSNAAPATKNKPQ